MSQPAVFMLECVSIIADFNSSLLQLLHSQGDDSDVELTGVEYYPPPPTSLDELEEEQDEGSTPYRTALVGEQEEEERSSYRITSSSHHVTSSSSFSSSAWDDHLHHRLDGAHMPTTSHHLMLLAWFGLPHHLQHSNGAHRATNLHHSRIT